MAVEDKSSKILTFGTVVSRPARPADSFPSGRAGVVAECVVPWPAEDFAAGPVVVRRTYHPVRQFQVGSSRLTPSLFLFHPRPSNISYTLLRHARD